MKLNILTYPNDDLTKTAEEVTSFDQELVNTVSDMIETMMENNGIGLSAPQVGINKRIIIVKHGVNVLPVINPKIIKSRGTFNSIEGCLSVPGIMVKIERSKRVTLGGQNINGEPIKVKLHRQEAAIAEHEIDHLMGKLIINNPAMIEKRSIPQAP